MLSSSSVEPYIPDMLTFPLSHHRSLNSYPQVVHDLAGTVLADDYVGYHFTIEHDLIQAMEVVPFHRPDPMPNHVL